MKDYYEYFVSYKYEKKANKKSGEAARSGDGMTVISIDQYVNDMLGVAKIARAIRKEHNYNNDDTIIIINFIYLNYNGGK